MSLYDDINNYANNARIQMLAKLAELYPGGKIGKFIGFTASGKRIFEVNGKQVIAKGASNTALPEYFSVVIDEAASAEWQKKKKKSAERAKAKKKPEAARQQRPKPGRVHIFEDQPIGDYIVKYSSVYSGRSTFNGRRFNKISGEVENGASGNDSQTVPTDDWNPYGDPSKIITCNVAWGQAFVGGFSPDIGIADVSAGSTSISINLSSSGQLELLWAGVDFGYIEQSVSLSSGSLDLVSGSAETISFVSNNQLTFFYSYGGNLYEFVPAAHLPLGNDLFLDAKSFRTWIADGILFETFTVVVVDLSVKLDDEDNQLSGPIVNPFLENIRVGKVKTYFMHLRMDLEDGTTQVRTTNMSELVTDHLFRAKENTIIITERLVANSELDFAGLNVRFYDWNLVATNAFEDDWIYEFKTLFESFTDLSFGEGSSVKDFCASYPNVASIDELRNASSVEFMFSSRVFLPFAIEEYSSTDDIENFTEARYSYFLTNNNSSGKAIDFFQSIDDIALFLNTTESTAEVKEGYDIDKNEEPANEILELNGLEWSDEPVTIVKTTGFYEYTATKVWVPDFELNLPTRIMAAEFSEVYDIEEPGALIYLGEPEILLI